MKKILAIMLSAAMLAAMLTGCSSKPAAAPDTQAPAATTAAAVQATTKAATEVTSENPDTWLCDEKTTITVLTYDATNATIPTASNDLKFWQWLEDRTNVHVEFEIVPYAGYDEVVSTRVASATDLPDIVVTRDFNTANNAGKNGIFVNLSDYWDNCFQNTENYFRGQGQDYRALIKNEDGSCYSLVGTVEPVENHLVLMYNTEWLQKVGKEVPKTLDEFTELLKAWKAAGDLNGNGEDDEVYLAGTSYQRHFASVINNIFGLNSYNGWDQFAVDANGKVFPEYTSENQKAYLKYMSELYKEGLVDPEITASSTDILSEKIAADRVGAFVYYSSFAVTYGQLTTAGQADPLAEHFTLGVPLASEYNGNEGYYVRREMANQDPTCVNSESENIELACKWLDTLFADPVVLRTRSCGFEGEDYELNADGTLEYHYQADGTLRDISQDGCGQISFAYIQTKEQMIDSMRPYQWYMDEYDDLRDNYKWVAPQITQVAAFTDEEQEKLDEVKTDCNDYYEKMRDKFITGAADVDAEWNEYCTNLEKLGLATWAEVWQSVYDRTK